MSYVAIARKWRPSSFEEICGQTHVTRTLQNALRLQRVHHAFLFTGARGVGKTSAARVLARALNCGDGTKLEPCGICASCTEIAAGQSPDVVEIDGASNNSVDDIRDLRDNVRYLPQGGRKKVYIIDEVHMLSRGAFNALLKTLEEPPEHVVFIFATTEAHKIPETILSRVQRFDFKRIPTAVVLARLQQVCQGEGVTAEVEALRLIARAGEGSMRDSQSLLDRVISTCGDRLSIQDVTEILGLVDRGLLFEVLEGIARGQPDRCLAVIDRVDSYGHDLSELTGELLELLRHATLLGLSADSQRYVDLGEDDLRRLRELGAGIPTDVWVRAFQVMLEVNDQVARAARPRMVLEMAVARLAAIRPLRPVDEVLERISGIERRLRHFGVQPRSPGDRPRAGGEPGPALDTRRIPEAPRRGDEPERAQVRAVSAAVAVARPLEQPHPETPPHAAAETWEEPMASELFSTPLFEVLPDPLVEETDDGGEGAERPPLPPLAPQADLETRVEAFSVWLRLAGPRYTLLASDVVITEARAPVVVVLAAAPFTLKRLEVLANDALLREVLPYFFPNCRNLELGLRGEGDPRPTRRERADLARQVERVRLEAELRADPWIQKLNQRLGGSITAVRPLDEPPPILGRR
jgi:DNA polymerase-3 subunit gamma/tau